MIPETPQSALEAVFVPSEQVPADAEIVKGYDFNQGIDYSLLMESYRRIGYQATSMGQAIEILNRMVMLVAFMSSWLGGYQMIPSCQMNHPNSKILSYDQLPNAKSFWAILLI